jgi:hypothetical protein
MKQTTIQASVNHRPQALKLGPRVRLLARYAGFVSLCSVWGGSVTVACGGDRFESCQASRTCDPVEAGGAGGGAGEGALPAGGSAGERASGGNGVTSGSGGAFQGEAGQAGQAGEPVDAEPDEDVEPEGSECDEDADCSDARYCSGVERCSAGRCLTGTDPCAGIDTEHCRVECDEVAEQCLVDALDQDGDGFASAACAAAPGDDCDDNDSAVHPDASETCDGIDNDCDGLGDLQDGFALAGTTRVLAEGTEVDVAWSPELEQFGVAIAGPGRFGMLASNGSVTAIGEGTALGPDPRISWSSGWFAVSGEASFNSTVRLTQLVNGDGVSSEPFPLAYGPSDFTPWVEGGWLEVTFGTLEGDDAYRLRVDVQPVSGEALPGGALGPVVDFSTLQLIEASIATQGKRSAVVWESDGVIDWSRLSVTFTASEPEQLATDAGVPDIAAAGSGYALAWPTTEGFAVALRGVDGNEICGPLAVPFGDGGSALNHQLRLAADTNQVFLLAADPEAGVGLFRFDLGCRLLDHTLLAEALEAPSDPALALGGGLLALGWSGADEDAEGVTARHARTRLVTDLLCE